MPSDTEIMKRVQAGETRLFELLVHRYRPRLLRFAGSKLGHMDQAEDVVQEAFLAAYQARQSYDETFAFSTWMWTIVLNLTRRALRRRQACIDRQDQYPHHANACELPGPLATLLALEQRAQLYDGLDAIPEEQADALRLRFFGSLSYADIALAMDISVSGAKRRVRRGLERLIMLLQADETPDRET